MNVKIYRIKHNLTQTDIVDALQNEFPKCRKATLSMCENADYGVKLTPKAERLLREKVEGEAFKASGRKLKHRLAARVTEGVYNRFTELCKERGVTVQDLMTEIVTEWLEKNKR